MKNASGVTMSWTLVLLVILLLAGLPVAVWLDLSNLADTNLRRQASDLNSIISSVRGYYASNVVGRILAAPGTTTKVVHDYENVPGAIPIPATLSLELGKVISEQQHNIAYRFVPVFPFANRAPHTLDAFETDALHRLRENPRQALSDVSSSLFSDRVRLVAPVIMGQACVNCHNAHPESPKRDWKVGDVRGIQEVTITQPIAGNILAFKYLLRDLLRLQPLGGRGEILDVGEENGEPLALRLDGDVLLAAENALVDLAATGSARSSSTTKRENRWPFPAPRSFPGWWRPAGAA